MTTIDELLYKITREGLRVFPCLDNKRPLVNSWTSEATTDLNFIDRWKKNERAKLWGIACELSGIFAVDLDYPLGPNTWLDWTIENGAPEPTPWQRTPRGGAHYLFKLPKGLNIPNVVGTETAGLAPGIDLRSRGYVCTGPGYEWIVPVGSVPIAEAPEWLLKKIKALDKTVGGNRVTTPAPLPAPGDAAAYWLDKFLPLATVGSRNATGFNLCLQLRDSGLSQGDAAKIMRAYADKVPQSRTNPYTTAEAMATLNEVYSEPPREPATIKTIIPNPPVTAPAGKKAPEGGQQSPPKSAQNGAITTLPTSTLKPSSEGPGVIPKGPPANLEPPDFGPEPDELKDTWQIYTLKDAYAPRQPIQYAVKGIFSLPSLGMVYGAPGDLKSMLCADLGICVSNGELWLPGAPWQLAQNAGIETQQSPVLWLDFDMGKTLTDNRMEALAKARSLPDNTPFYYVVMPSPWLDASKPGSIGMLSLRAQRLEAKLIIIDNLGTISGGIDENSSAMIQVMSNLRKLVEETGAAVVLIHHQRKTTGFNSRSGDSLRGHSSIEAALDLALQIERDNDILTIKSTKTRGVDVPPFSAVWTYSHKPDSHELETAKFYGLQVEDLSSNTAITREIKAALTGQTMNQTALATAVKATLPDVGINRIRNTIEKLAADKIITYHNGNQGARIYSLC